MNSKTTPFVNTNTYRVSTASMSSTMTRITGVDSVFPTAPKVVYTERAAAQIEFIVDKCAKEVGWFHLVKYDEKAHSYLIYDTIVPQQTVSHTETDITPEGLAVCINDLINEGRADEVQNMYAWFHSHVNMGVSPSGQDERQVEEFLETAPVFIRGIVNKKGDSKVDVYYRDLGIAFTCVREEVIQPDISEFTAGLEDLLKTRITEQHYNYQRPWNNSNLAGTRPQNANRLDNYLPSAQTTSFRSQYNPEVDDYDYKKYSPFNALDDENDDAEMGFPNYLDDDADDQIGATGYGLDWDEDDPIEDRPLDWFTDLTYITYGSNFDPHVNDQVLAQAKAKLAGDKAA